MTTAQIALARHALGLSDPACKRKSYRNRFAALAGSPDCAEWEAMAVAGYAVAHPSRPSSGLRDFYLTPAGALLALKPGESLSPEDFPVEVKA